MDIDVTQRLIKESIICLCRNHFCLENTDDIKFEIDGIICISTDDKKSDKYTVFKIHEWITSSRNTSSNHLINKSNSDYDPMQGNKNSVICSVQDDPLDVKVVSDNCETVQPVMEYPKVPSTNGLSLTPISSRKRKSNSPRHQSQLRSASNPSVASVDLQYSQSQLRNCQTSIEKPTLYDKNIISQSVKEEIIWFDETSCSSTQGHGCEDEIGEKSVTGSDCEGNSDSLAFSCAHCDVVCITHHGIKDHIRNSHDTNQSWICLECRIGFSSNESYRSHCCLHGCKIADNDIDYNEANSHKVSSAIDSIDDYVSNAKRRYVLDAEDTVHKNQSFNKSKSLDSKELNIIKSLPPLDSEYSENDSNPDSVHICSMCCQEFPDFPSYNVHSANVHLLYPCPYCEKTFTQQSERELHLFEHTGESPHDCPTCGLNFTNVELLDAHKIQAHTSKVSKGSSASRPAANKGPAADAAKIAASAAAVIQPSAVSSRSSSFFFLTPTIDISDEDEEFSSDQMNSSTATPDPFQTFKCDVCDEVISGFDPYSDHCALAHRRTPCPYCGGTFSQKASMERHQRLHTGVKPFRCTLCPLSFTRKEPLRTHLSRTHKINDFYIL